VGPRRVVVLVRPREGALENVDSTADHVDSTADHVDSVFRSGLRLQPAFELVGR
jgi:hypothetical protein